MEEIQPFTVGTTTEKKFITSHDNIEVHRKVSLQDAEVSEEHQNNIKKLVGNT